MNKFAFLPYALVACALTSGAAVAAGGTNFVRNTDVSAARSGGSGYWTPERIQAAKPMFRTKDDDGLSAASAGTANLDFTRARVIPKNAKQKPYQWAGKLYFTIPGQGDFQCTASVIKKRLVLTAAHCLYSDGIGFHNNWEFIPAFDGSAATLDKQRPFGTWTWSFAVVPINWVNTGGALPNNTDFAILVVNDQSFNGGPLQTVSKKVGGAFVPVLGHLFDTHVSMLGYPCNFDNCNIQQRNDSSDHRVGSPPPGNNAFEYGSDMTGGSSGGPWVENLGDPANAAPTGSFNTRNAVVGVTSYGFNDPNVHILGASSLSADFTTILDQACAGAGNC